MSGLTWAGDRSRGYGCGLWHLAEATCCNRCAPHCARQLDAPILWWQRFLLLKTFLSEKRFIESGDTAWIARTSKRTAVLIVKVYVILLSSFVLLYRHEINPHIYLSVSKFDRISLGIILKFGDKTRSEINFQCIIILLVAFWLSAKQYCVWIFGYWPALAGNVTNENKIECEMDSPHAFSPSLNRTRPLPRSLCHLIALSFTPFRPKVTLYQVIHILLCITYRSFYILLTVIRPVKGFVTTWKSHLGTSLNE